MKAIRFTIANLPLIAEYFDDGQMDTIRTLCKANGESDYCYVLIIYWMGKHHGFWEVDYGYLSKRYLCSDFNFPVIMTDTYWFPVRNRYHESH